MAGEKKREADIRGKDGFFFEGDVLGHANDESRIRSRDGVFFRGEEIGSVDESDQIRRKDGVFFRGDVVGQVKDGRAHAKDGVFFSGEEWGYVDADGNVRQKDGVFLRGRIIGKMKGNNPKAALGFFVLRFQGIVDKVDALEKDVEREANKARFLGPIRSMLKWVPEADALGDFDTLIRRLKRLESTVQHQLDGNLRRKKDLCSKAENLSSSSDWKTAGDAIKALQADWKTIGPVPQDEADALWERFRKAVDRFYARREEHFKARERQQHENLHRKERLCEKAESLSHSTDWKSAGEALKALQSEWKAVGPVPKERGDALWTRFRSAQDHFYHRRSAYYEQREREHEKKQAEWRSRMRETLEHKREQAERLRESINHDQETVSRWHSTIYNLRPGARADEIRSSLETKIYEVEHKISSKRSRLHDLESAIQEIRSKLS